MGEVDGSNWRTSREREKSGDKRRFERRKIDAGRGVEGRMLETTRKLTQGFKESGVSVARDGRSLPLD